MEKERFSLTSGANLTWMVTDKESGVCVRFRNGHFNDTQETSVPDNLTNISEIARILREIGDYVAKYNYDIAICK